MTDLNNAPPVANMNPVVENKVVDTKVKVQQPMLRPLPEVDQNELHCIIDPVYPVYSEIPAQNVIVEQRAPNIGYDTSGVVPQGSGMVRQEGYVEKKTTIKETIKVPTVM